MRIPVLDFHGNGNVVCLEGLKPQAASSKLQALMSGSGLLTPGPGAKPQAPSVRQIDARHFVLLTQAPSTKLQAPSFKPQAPSVKQPD